MAIRHYKVTLTADGTIHIGNGMKYGKNDYFIVGKKIAVLDAKKFVGMLDKSQLEQYCRHLDEGNSRKGLQDFLNKHGDLLHAAESCIAYMTETELKKTRDKKSYQYLDVAEFIKDAYGCPYVPGSSVKGMLRTAIMIRAILNDRDRFSRLYDPKEGSKAIEKEIFGQSPHENFMRFVSVSDSEPLNPSCLAFVKKYDKFAKTDDGRHKKQMGRISDDQYYEGNELNIYRECLKPGTAIELTIDIDDRIDERLGFSLDAQGISDTLKCAQDLYSKRFLNHFETDESDDSPAGDGRCRYIIQEGPFAGDRCRNAAATEDGYCNLHAGKSGSSDDSRCDNLICCLGGSIDFDSKTVINALFDDQAKAVGEAAHILFKQFKTELDPDRYSSLEKEVREAGFKPERMRAIIRNGRIKKAKDDHRHWKDIELGVSPHTLKMGILDGKKYLMGKCSLKLEEE